MYKSQTVLNFSTSNKILKYIRRSSPYRAVNTLRLGCKNQSVNAVWEVIAVCSETHTKHINTVRAESRIYLMLNLAVHIVSLNENHKH
jgi:hypothetical protein